MSDYLDAAIKILIKDRKCNLFTTVSRVDAIIKVKKGESRNTAAKHEPSVFKGRERHIVLLLFNFFEKSGRERYGS